MPALLEDNGAQAAHGVIVEAGVMRFRLLFVVIVPFVSGKLNYMTAL